MASRSDHLVGQRGRGGGVQAAHALGGCGPRPPGSAPPGPAPASRRRAGPASAGDAGGGRGAAAGRARVAHGQVHGLGAPDRQPGVLGRRREAGQQALGALQPAAGRRRCRSGRGRSPHARQSRKRAAPRASSRAPGRRGRRAAASAARSPLVGQRAATPRPSSPPRPSPRRPSKEGGLRRVPVAAPQRAGGPASTCPPASLPATASSSIAGRIRRRATACRVPGARRVTASPRETGGGGGRDARGSARAGCAT